MVTKNFIEKNSGKVVHIDYINDRNELVWSEGKLIGEDYNDETEEGFIEIETETDSDRIPEKCIRKVYIKEGD